MLRTATSQSELRSHAVAGGRPACLTRRSSQDALSSLTLPPGPAPSLHSPPALCHCAAICIQCERGSPKNGLLWLALSRDVQVGGGQTARICNMANGVAPYFISITTLHALACRQCALTAVGVLCLASAVDTVIIIDIVGRTTGLESSFAALASLNDSDFPTCTLLAYKAAMVLSPRGALLGRS